MAGGKLTPRQKMINMMYLVLTAMLALNVSREVMDFLYEDMKSKEQSIATIERQNSSIYTAFANAASENEEKAGPWRDKAYKVRTESNKLSNEIDSIISYLITATGGFEESSEKENAFTEKPKKMNNREKVAQYMIKDKHGFTLKDNIDAYRAFMLTVANDNEKDGLAANITILLSTDPITSEGNNPEPWVSHNFEHYPLISVLSTLTTIKSKIKSVESQTIDMLEDNIDAGSFKFTGVRAIIQPKSTYIMQGEQFEAEVFLAAYDETQEPIIMVNDAPIAITDINDGVGKVTLGGQKIGENKWAGKIIIRHEGEDKTYEFESSYIVAPPSVVISPIKMNVLYRNVQNPLEISVPGVDNSKVSASGPGLRKTASGYMADVTRVSGTEITINVTVTNDDGTKKSMGGKKFRIKGLPQAQGMFLKKSTILASKNAIKSQRVEAAYPDFPFDLKLKVVRFEIKIEGQPPITIQGDRLNSSTKQLVDRLRTGSSITIRKIVATAPNGSRITNIGNISIDVN